jgi:RHS repeat-associated protein
MSNYDPSAVKPNRDLITTVSNTFGTATISAFNYENDGLGRRTARVDTTPTLTVNNAFGYNLRSEVTSATMANGESSYNYDPIGNRIYAAFNAETNTYSANALNQYCSINPLNPVNPVQEISPSYDLDGNMVTNGVWSYTWDAENRLTSVYSNDTLLVSNTYDHQSRRIAKIISRSGAEAQRNTFVYDGWNLVQEKLFTSNLSLSTFYTWGLDLSGTLQGAGGVGGLLAVQRGSASFFPCFDANGNVTEYIDASGTIRAHYAFDTFGNTISQSDDLASTFSQRFSTKYADDETSLYYYGYRFYSPELGRWVNRDPIEEQDGVNVYAFVRNDVINNVDNLGLLKVVSGNKNGKCGCIPTEEIEKYFNDNVASPIFEQIREPFRSAVKTQFKNMVFTCRSNDEDKTAGDNCQSNPNGYSNRGIFADITYDMPLVIDENSGKITRYISIPAKKAWNNTATLCNDQLGNKKEKWLRTAIHETAHNIGWGNVYKDDADASFSNYFKVGIIKGTGKYGRYLETEHRTAAWGIPKGDILRDWTKEERESDK